MDNNLNLNGHRTVPWQLEVFEPQKAHLGVNSFTMTPEIYRGK
jgi:hypothetical protein